MPEPILDVRDLTVDFKVHQSLLQHLFRRGDAPRVRAVDGIGFQLGDGEILGLVGESGSGKSTTGLSVLRLTAIGGGSIRFRGEDIAAHSGAALHAFRRHAQMIFQDPYQSLNPRFTIRDAVCEPLTIHRIADGAEADRLVAQTLDEVGLRPARSFLARFPHELSGGQRQRVAIARAMVLRPSLLVADEPVSMLDVSVRAGILRLLGALNRERGLSVLYISHDISTVRYLCDRTAVMYLGHIVECGSTASVLRSPTHPYTRALLAAVPRARGGVMRQRVQVPLVGSARPAAGCVFQPRCAQALDICRTITPRERTTADGKTVACHLHDAAGRGA